MLLATTAARLVLKIANPASGRPRLACRTRPCTTWGSASRSRCRCRARRVGREIVAGGAGRRTYRLRLVRLIERSSLSRQHHLPLPVLRALGATARRSRWALADFDHPAADRGDAVGSLARRRRRRRAAPRGGPARHALVSAAGERRQRPSTGWRRRCGGRSSTATSPTGTSSAGATRPAALQPCGVIDFGDVMRSLLACSSRSSLRSLCHARTHPIGRSPPCSAASRGVLRWPTPSSRRCPTCWPRAPRSSRSAPSRRPCWRPTTRTRRAHGPASGAICRRLATMDLVATAAFRLACGARPPPSRRGFTLPTARPLRGLAARRSSLDLSPRDDALDDHRPAIAPRRRGRPHAARSAAYGERGCTRHAALERRARHGPARPRPLRTGPLAPSSRRSRAASSASSADLVLAADGLALRLAGLAPAVRRRPRRRGRPAAGTSAPPADPPPHLHVQVANRCRSATLPALVSRRWPTLAGRLPRPLATARAACRRARRHGRPRAAWPCTARPAALLRRAAARSCAGCASSSTTPTAARTWTPSTTSRWWGTATPRRRRGVRQLRLPQHQLALPLRLHDPLRRAARRPPARCSGAVFLVSSGLRGQRSRLALARAATGRADVICIRDAYHGWTIATYAVSTRRSTTRGRVVAARLRAPGALARHLSRRFGTAARTPPSATQTPCTRRSPTGRAPAARRPPSSCERGLRQRRRRLARRGYLAQTYSARAGGGRRLTIADEVQVGSVGWASASGASSSRASCPIWSRSPSSLVTGIRWAPSSRPRAIAASYAAAGRSSSRRSVAAPSHVRSGDGSRRHR